MTQASIYVCNYLGVGEEFQPTTAGQARTLIRVRLGSRRVEIHQDVALVLATAQDYRGLCVPTTRIHIPTTKSGDQKAALRLARDLCWLLSIASMSRVVAYRLDCPPGTMRSAWSVVGTVGKSWSLIDIRNGLRVRQFLESTYPTFRRLEGKRHFIACIDALLAAEAGTVPEELRMVAVYVTLEMLKDTWARARKIPFVRGRFRRPDHVSRKGELGFKELVAMMCSEVGMRPSLTRLVKYRDALIHSGGLRLSASGKARAYNVVQRLVREYILRRLGYRGPYVVFGSLRMKALR